MYRQNLIKTFYFCQQSSAEKFKQKSSAFINKPKPSPSLFFARRCIPVDYNKHWIHDTGFQHYRVYSIGDILDLLRSCYSYRVTARVFSNPSGETLDWSSHSSDLLLIKFQDASFEQNVVI